MQLRSDTRPACKFKKEVGAARQMVDTVERPLTAISPQRPPLYNGLFFGGQSTDIDSCLNLSTKAP